MSDIKDHGHRDDFGTGSVRDTGKGKGRYDLISPLAMHRLALILEGGADKYGDRNWEKGQPMSRYISSGLRHLHKYMLGMRDEDHLAMAFWNLHGALHTEEMCAVAALPPSLSDLPGLDMGVQEDLVRMFDMTVPEKITISRLDINDDLQDPPVV